MSAILHQAVMASLGSAAAAGGVAAPTLTGSPTLVASWDFDNASTVTLSGGDIDSISGSDGTSYTLLTPGNMPSQESRSSKNTARFTAASSEYMQIADALGITSEVTIVLIAEPAATGVLQGAVDIADGTAAGTAQRHFLFANTSSTGWVMRTSSTTARDAVQGSAYAAAATLVIGRKATGTTVAELNVNGIGTAVTSASTSTGPTAPTHTTLGARRASSAQDLPFDGWVWRVLIYSSKLSDTAAEEVAVWAASNYGTTNAA